jgi:hypothetical protein
MNEKSIMRRDFLKTFYSAAAVLAVIPVSFQSLFSKQPSSRLSRSSDHNDEKSEKKIEAILHKYGAEFGGIEAAHVSRQKKGESHGRI